MAKKCPAMTLDGNKIGLALGGTFAIVHLLWAIMVKIGFAAKFLDWVLSLHSMNLAYGMYPFSIGNAVFLVIVTFILGYVVGWLFATVYNCVTQKCKI